MAIFFALTTGLLGGILGMSVLFHHLINTNQEFRDAIIKEATVWASIYSYFYSSPAQPATCTDNIYNTMRHPSQIYLPT